MRKNVGKKSKLRSWLGEGEGGRGVGGVGGGGLGKSLRSSRTCKQEDKWMRGRRVSGRYEAKRNVSHNTQDYTIESFRRCETRSCDGVKKSTKCPFRGREGVGFRAGLV